jgi:hypothetical protein
VAGVCPTQAEVVCGSTAITTSSVSSCRRVRRVR